MPGRRVVNLGRTLGQLQRARDRAYPAMYEYEPRASTAPPTLRFMTLAEAQGLECNRCGQCCGSEEADLEGFALRQYAFGAIPQHQWRALNGGAPLIIPLTSSGRPRHWRPADDAGPPFAAFRCTALQHEASGATTCALWQAERPPECDAFPLDAAQSAEALRGGAYILLATTYQRLCTWVDVVLCPDDAVLLAWRRSDGTLRRGLSARRQAYVDCVVCEAYRDAYPRRSDAEPVDWPSLRTAEAALAGRTRG